MIYNYCFYAYSKDDSVPSWAKSEELYNCDSYIKVFSFLKNKF